MAVDIVDLALGFIAAYGLIAMFILLVLDGAMLLPVFPGEIVLIMAVAAYGHDPASLVMLIVVTTAAGLLGSIILYAGVRGGGRRLVERYPRLFMMPKRRRERLERSFQKPLGQSLVLFLRLVPLTRILVNIPAGLARMPVVRFVVLSTIGLAAYHAGFLWFTYEANRPGSAISTERERLQAAYASPAWEFVETNAIITGAALLILGAVLSVRASARMHRAEADESTGSLLGTLSILVLFWGGIALGVATYVDPETVYSLAQAGGVDVHGAAAAIGLGPLQALWATAAAATLLGLTLGRLRSGARKRRRHRLHLQRVMQRVREREERAAEPPAPPTPAPATFAAIEHESTVHASRRAGREEPDAWGHVDDDPGADGDGSGDDDPDDTPSGDAWRPVH